MTPTAKAHPSTKGTPMTDEPEARDLEAMTRGREQALDLANRRHGEAIRAAERERAAIVAWLRDPANVMRLHDPFIGRTKAGDIRAGSRENIGICMFHVMSCADAIERGDHVKEREG